MKGALQIQIELITQLFTFVSGSRVRGKRARRRLIVRSGERLMILYHTSLRAGRNESASRATLDVGLARSYLEWDAALSQITYFT